MKNRIPTPGKENRVKITQDNGAVVEGVLAYADDAIQEGSVYSKENVLPDSICTRFRVDPDAAEPKDIFARIAPSNLELIQKYTTAGSYEWTVPETGEYIAFIMGGGGGGAAEDTSYYCTGGAAGFWNIFRGNLEANNVVPVVVGLGGAGNLTGVAGGSSAFNGITANGGAGGTSGSTGEADGASGSQCSSRGNSTQVSIPPYGGVPVHVATTSSYPVTHGYPIYNLFLDEQGLPVTMLCAGGNHSQSTSITLPNLKTNSAGKVGSTKPLKATDVGAGGGALKYTTYNAGVTIGADGVDGGVFIYKLGVTA